MSDEAARPSTGLMEAIARGMPITADLSRSDILLVRPMNPEQVVVVAQAQPHSISPLYSEDLTDRIFTGNDAPVILEAWRRRRHLRVHVELPGRAQVRQDVRPIQDETGQVIGLLSIETSLIQIERHRQRRPAFRRAIEWLKAMCLRGELSDTASLSPFCESDGILLADHQRRITYVSGIAGSLYRRLGYREDLRGQRLTYLQSCDDEMAVDRGRDPTARGAGIRDGRAHLHPQGLAGLAAGDAARTGGGLAARSCGPGRRGRRADHGARCHRRAPEAARARGENHHDPGGAPSGQEQPANHRGGAADAGAAGRRQRHTAGAERSDQPDPQRGGDPRVPVAGREPDHQHPRRLSADRGADPPGAGAGAADRLLGGRAGHLFAQPTGDRVCAGDERADPERAGTWI